jgi:hypothetical protein
MIGALMGWEAAMATIRRYLPEIDKPRCEECCDRAEVVIEEYPTPNQCRTLCRDCATTALQAHPDLLASLVITLILNNRPVVASFVRAL